MKDFIDLFIYMNYLYDLKTAILARGNSIFVNPFVTLNYVSCSHYKHLFEGQGYPWAIQSLITVLFGILIHFSPASVSALV